MRMATHFPIASLLVSAWPESLEKQSDQQTIPRKACPSHMKHILNQAVYGQIPHRRVMLVCNACFLLRGFCPIISELSEQALAQRTRSPGCFGMTQLLPAVVLKGCFPYSCEVTREWMLGEAGSVTLSEFWNIGSTRSETGMKTCWVEEQSRQKPCHSWVSLEVQVMQGDTCMVTDPKPAGKMKNMGSWLFSWVFVHMSFHLEWEGINAVILELV